MAASTMPASTLATRPPEMPAVTLISRIGCPAVIFLSKRGSTPVQALLITPRREQPAPRAGLVEPFHLLVDRDHLLGQRHQLPARRCQAERALGARKKRQPEFG